MTYSPALRFTSASRNHSDLIQSIPSTNTPRPTTSQTLKRPGRLSSALLKFENYSGLDGGESLEAGKSGIAGGWV